MFRVYFENWVMDETPILEDWQNFDTCIFYANPISIIRQQILRKEWCLYIRRNIPSEIELTGKVFSVSPGAYQYLSSIREQIGFYTSKDHTINPFVILLLFKVFERFKFVRKSLSFR